MSYNNYNTQDYSSQVTKILTKTAIKKSLNKPIIEWLYNKGLPEKAEIISQCGNHIGITDINGIAHIVKADFCRERICSVCAWRRQSKFMSQMFPILEIIGKSCEFLLVTLTMQSVTLDELNGAIDIMLTAYDKLLKRRKIKRAWLGKVRALEVTYNKNTQMFHPHLHLFVSVKKEYFLNNDLYISQAELSALWGECLSVGYEPICDIRKVTEEKHGAVETLKYTFKTTKDHNALEGYYFKLKGRRLVSFSGNFAKVRKQLALSDFENVLTDDLPNNGINKYRYVLYKFDATGGLYNYFKEMEIELNG
jgi:plasmid rolling circle replication initiator protein Rep